MHRVYVSASTQSKNVGVGQYGTEQDRMQFLADRVEFWLRTQVGKFEVFRNRPGWTLEQTVKDCNALACALFVDNHTNAGSSSAGGTEVYYNGLGGATSHSYRFAKLLYDAIAPLSPGKDRGIKADTAVSANGLYVVRRTEPSAVLIEHFFHTNLAEVKDYLSDIDAYALAEAKAIAAFFDEKWVTPKPAENSVAALVAAMVKAGLITDEATWTKVLLGTAPAKAEFLQIVFARAVSKIR